MTGGEDRSVFGYSMVVKGVEGGRAEMGSWRKGIAYVFIPLHGVCRKIVLLCILLKVLD